jgi:hypothetical protein
VSGQPPQNVLDPSGVTAILARAQAAQEDLPRPSLDEIGLRFGTDKASHWHGYLAFYERMFAALRDHPVTLLEIGVLAGDSLRMWQAYFELGRIVGADINPAAARHARERITVEVADQSRNADLERLAALHGPFDIVVDDGSHIWDHQILTLQTLFPSVKPGGFFVVEDIDTSFGDYVPTYRGTSPISTFEYVQRLAEYVTAGGKLDLAAESDAFIRDHAGDVEFVALHRRTVVLRRRPTVPPVRLLLHLGGRGDVDFGTALAGGTPGSPAHVQGFSVSLTSGAPADLQYRAQMDDGSWTGWVEAGHFVGTRGVGRSLHGFALRLGGDLARQYSCDYAGLFAGEAASVHADEGADCCGARGGPLQVMKLFFRPRAG